MEDKATRYSLMDAHQISIRQPIMGGRVKSNSMQLVEPRLRGEQYHKTLRAQASLDLPEAYELV
jgi:hypothetical protein